MGGGAFLSSLHYANCRIVCAVVTPSVLEAWTSEEAEAYFYRFFWDAPAHTALSVLSQ